MASIPTSCEFSLGKPSVLCLDLEGTLISNAISQFPRPDLIVFLDACRLLFERVAIYTSVPEKTFRQIAAVLVNEGVAPVWFSNIEYINWYGAVKDLACVPGVTCGEVLLIDDMDIVIHPDQRDQWIPISPFVAPYLSTDDELQRVLGVLQARLGVGRGS